MIDLSELASIDTRLRMAAPASFKRFLFEKADWRNRLIGITGGRGVGKTTLLLQALKERSEKNLYISADHVLVEGIGLYEIGDAFFKTGGTLLAVDEIHKRQQWAQEIKSLYDSFPAAQIMFSGSSTLRLQLGKADLSRRAVYYRLPVLSFREFLSLRTGANFQPLLLDDLLKSHSELAADVQRTGPVLAFFSEYLEHGAYPFFLEGENTFLSRLGNVIEKVLYEDIPPVTGLKLAGIPVMKKILYEVATSAPYEMNIDKMAGRFGVSRPSVYNYLTYLEEAGLIRGVFPKGSGSTITRKPHKLYLENTNLLRAAGLSLSPADPMGTIRETYFACQLESAGYRLRTATKGDFVVDEKYRFEIGGKSKGKRQVSGEKEAYLVRDDTVSGFDRIIPLWAFGFLY